MSVRSVQSLQIVKALAQSMCLPTIACGVLFCCRALLASCCEASLNPGVIPGALMLCCDLEEEEEEEEEESLFKADGGGGASGGKFIQG